MATLTIDELQVLITAQTKNFNSQIKGIQDQLEGIDKTSGKMSKSSAAAFGVIAGAAQSLVTKGINLITSSIGSAAKRIDTLNNSNRVFQNMGFSAGDTKKEMDFLNKSILGLPTSLDDAVGSVEALSSVSGNLGDSVRTYKALNDGILAFGGSADEVRGAVLQLSQLPLDGPLDAQTWNSLRQNGLTPVFSAMAKDSHKSIGQLKDDFGNGTLTVKDFTKELQKLDKDGGGGMASLNKQAHDATSGIQTGWANAETAITRGLADIIKAIGSKNISDVIKNFGSILENALKDISTFIKFISDHSAIFGTIAAAIGAIIAVMTVWATVTKLVAVAQTILNIAMAANPIGAVIALVAALVAGLAYFFTQTDTGRKIFQTAMDAIKNAAMAVWNWIKSNWPLLLAILTGPIGLAVLAITKNLDVIKSAFTTAWNTVKGVWSAATGFFGGVWSGITRAFKGTASWFSNTFRSAYNGVRSAFGGIVGYFSGLWGQIRGVFTSIGDKVGSAVGAAFKSVLNTAMSWIQNRINGFIGSINSIIGSIDHVTPGSLPRIGMVSLPRFAAGGIVPPGYPNDSYLARLTSGEVVLNQQQQQLLGGRNIPVNVNIDGKTLLSFVIDGINNKAFMTNSSVIDF